MKKLLILVASVISFSSLVYCQTIKSIKQSGQYLCGIGTDMNPQKADAAALHELVSQISTTVKSLYEYEFKNGSSGFIDNAQAIVKTYSHVTLNFASKIEEESDKGFTVLRYIKKEDVSKLFDARAKKIESYTRLAIAAEEENRVGDALRYYYWAFILLKTIRHVIAFRLKKHRLILLYMKHICLTGLTAFFR